MQKPHELVLLLLHVWEILHSVVDPALARRGGGWGSPGVRGKNLLFGKIFAENFMNMKEFGPAGGGGGGVSSNPLDSPMNYCSLNNVPFT